MRLRKHDPVHVRKPRRSEQKESGGGWLMLLGGFGLGAGLMYALDPDIGSRRRASFRGKAVHSAHEVTEGLDRAGRDLRHRTGGLLHRIRALFEQGPISDDVLHEHVRAELGRHVSHRKSIHVEVRDGTVILHGPILALESDGLLRAVRRLRGVRDVDDRLDVHETAGKVPGLQGEPSPMRREPRIDFFQESWSPGTRLVATLVGAMLGVRAFRGGLLGPAYATAGGGLLLRGITNKPVKRLLGIGAGRRAFDFHKTITVYARIDDVFRFWTQLENFPRFMEHVKEVRVLDDKRSRWKVTGPAGIPVEWEAEVTRSEPNQVFAWKTLPGATVEHAGIIRFEDVAGATRLDIRMSYNPPAGALGHVVAALFRKDPKAAMDDDLLRMKSLLEEGKATAHGESVTIEELL